MSRFAEGSLVSAERRQRLRGGVTPFATALGAVGLTPNALTVIGFLISIVAAGAAAGQLWLAAGLISLFGAAFDMLDGALARATGTTSKLGSFLDSTFDRWGEAVLYAGISAGAVFAREPVTAILAVLALSSAFMVSYVRAKAESLGFRAEVGIAPRPERVVLLGAGLILAGLFGGLHFTPWLQLSLGLLFLISTITTVQRIWYVSRQASATKEDL